MEREDERVKSFAIASAGLMGGRTRAVWSSRQARSRSACATEIKTRWVRWLASMAFGDAKRRLYAGGLSLPLQRRGAHHGQLDAVIRF